MTTAAFPERLERVQNIVVLMKENHSYDNYFGMLERGDGFTLGPDGQPINSNPNASGASVRVHHFAVPINPSFAVSQTWNASHLQWNQGRMDGFVTTTASEEPMGYFNESDLPWYYGLARTFGIADRYFSSCLAQTFPNRRFLQAGTADGLVSTSLPGPFIRPPKTGLIWDRLDAANVDWANYYVEVPEVGLWPRNLLHYRDHLHAIERFHDDCQAGTLPAVTLITPDAAFLSDGEYQDDQLGEAFTAWIYESLRQSPQWPTLMFVVTWDEGGGFYDHVPPPAAPKPDDVPPAIHVPPDEPGGYDRYGFRVPCIVASPYSKPGHVSSLVYDHTSILATIEQRWQLRPLTARDAAATPLWDLLDLDARPALLDPPALPEPRIWPFPSQ